MNTTDKPATLNCPTPLPHLGAIRVTGEEAETFLQGQLTCDLAQLTERLSLPAAYCSPKGRAIASFQIIKKQQMDFLLILSEELVEKVSARLKLFVMRSKVHIEEIQAPSFIGGLLFKPGEPLPAELEIATETQNIVTSGSTTALKLPGKPTRFLTFSEQPTPHDFEESQLGYHTNQWILEDIKNGLPLIGAATSELFIPQMFNLDLLGGISFKKGCYTGQEIIARMHYLGKLKQRTFLASSRCTTLPEAGAPIFCDEQKVGTILMTARDDEDGSTVKLLVVLQLAQAKHAVYLKNSQDSPLILEDLPYTFET